MMITMRSIFLCAVCLLITSIITLRADDTSQSALTSVDNLPYPQGKQFPLGLYSLDTRTMDELKEVRNSGWNMGHSYGSQSDLLDRVSQGNMYAFAHIGEKDEAKAKSLIEKMSSNDNIAWWDIPEEQRYWQKSEFDIVKNYNKWGRQYDPKQRPIFSYLPVHYSAANLAHYIPYLDIIGAGTYTEYAHMPHAWVRYRIESVIESIQIAGFKVGPNYLQGEKTPIGIPMCFSDQTMKTQFDPITATGAYHDFYSCLAAGAKGLLVFSYFHRKDSPETQKAYTAYAKAASELANKEIGLGQALLFGINVPTIVQITKGATRTEAFRPSEVKKDISYDSINVRTMKWQNSLYILAVNSAEQSIEANITLKTLLPQTNETQVLFENRTMVIKNGQFQDKFGPLGVHIYKMPL